MLSVGARGASGRLPTEELLNRGQIVKVIGRSPEKIAATIREHDNMSVMHASLLDLSNAELAQYARSCDAVASRLGHNVDFKGI